jgi:hypothetical protein
MRRWLPRLAVMVVRAWTRAYTKGMDADVRRRRCAEIESDIWESLHDPENTDATGAHILVRFARGAPADLSWRLEHTLTGGQLMWRKLALLCIATATVMAILWSFSPPSEPLSLPNLPATPIPIYVEKRRGPPPPPPPPPSWEEFVAKWPAARTWPREFTRAVNGKQPQRPAEGTRNRR